MLYAYSSEIRCSAIVFARSYLLKLRPFMSEESYEGVEMRICKCL